MQAADLSPIMVALQAARSSEDAEEQLHQLNQATADLDIVPEAAAAVRTVLSSMADFSGADVQLHGCAALHTLLQGSTEAANRVFLPSSSMPSYAIVKAMATYPDNVKVQLWGARALKSMFSTVSAIAGGVAVARLAVATRLSPQCSLRYSSMHWRSLRCAVASSTSCTSYAASPASTASIPAAPTKPPFSPLLTPTSLAR